MTIRAPLIGLLVAVLIGVAFVFLLYRPRSAEQQTLQAETAQLQAQQASLEAEIADLERVRADEPRIRDLLGQIEALIPAEVAQPQVLDEFETLAGAAGIDLRSLTFSDPVAAVPAVQGPEGQQLAEVTTTLVLEGEYFQALDFLRRVEQDGPRAVLVENLALAEGEEQFPSLAATITARLFALVPAETLAVAGAPVTPAPTASPTPSATDGSVPAPLEPTEGSS